MTANKTLTPSVRPEDLRDFLENGFVKLNSLLDPEAVRAIEPEITAKVIALNTQHLPLEERTTYGKAFLQVVNLWQHSEEVRKFVQNPDLARAAAELLQVDGVRLYHDQALYKEAGGGITPWHADQYYWPFSTDRCVTAWIPLQATPAEMGPLAFAAGSHKVDLGRDLPISDESELRMRQSLEDLNLPVDNTPFALGDVSFHLGWTFHRAEQNTSTTARRVMTVIYMDADMVISEPTNDFQRADFAACMPGATPGGIPVGPLNPVLYERIRPGE